MKWFSNLGAIFLIVVLLLAAGIRFKKIALENVPFYVQFFVDFGDWAVGGGEEKPEFAIPQPKGEEETEQVEVAEKDDEVIIDDCVVTNRCALEEVDPDLGGLEKEIENTEVKLK